MEQTRASGLPTRWIRSRSFSVIGGKNLRRLLKISITLVSRVSSGSSEMPETLKEFTGARPWSTWPHRASLRCLATNLFSAWHCGFQRCPDRTMVLVPSQKSCPVWFMLGLLNAWQGEIVRETSCCTPSTGLLHYITIHIALNTLLACCISQRDCKNNGCFPICMMMTFRRVIPLNHIALSRWVF